eukprot:5442429-Pleurochrysis_carterae.AAC.4
MSARTCVCASVCFCACRSLHEPATSLFRQLDEQIQRVVADGLARRERVGSMFEEEIAKVFTQWVDKHLVAPTINSAHVALHYMHFVAVTYAVTWNFLNRQRARRFARAGAYRLAMPTSFTAFPTFAPILPPNSISRLPPTSKSGFLYKCATPRPH